VPPASRDNSTNRVLRVPRLAMSSDGAAPGGIDGMQQPEAGNFAGREIATRATRIAAQGGPLLVEDFDHLLQQLEEAGTGADLHHGRHEPGVVGEVAGAVAHDTGNRYSHQVAAGSVSRRRRRFLRPNCTLRSSAPEISSCRTRAWEA
jgi:hypothetical protein